MICNTISYFYDYTVGKYRYLYVKVIRVATYFKDILREEALRFS